MKRTMRKTMRRPIISIVLAVALVMIPVSGAFAAPDDTVSVTAQPGYMSISNTPNNWVINDVDLNTGKYINVDTLYYSNPLGDETPPANPVVNGDCLFAVTNTSGINVDIIVNFPDPASGESTNSDAATNGATTFAAHSYTSYATFNAWPADKQIAKTTNSTALLTTTVAGDEFWWGLEYESQVNAWTGGTAMVSTVTITATPS